MADDSLGPCGTGYVEESNLIQSEGAKRKGGGDIWHGWEVAREKRRRKKTTAFQGRLRAEEKRGGLKLQRAVN